MKYRLASKTTKPPHGWMFTQYPTIWAVKNPLSVSWQGAIDQIFSFRTANPGYNLSTSQDAIAADLEAFTVARLQTDPRALHLLIPDDEESKKNAPAVQVSRGLRSAVVDAVARIKQDARGARAIADWLGHGGQPVLMEQATWRASVCQTCPKNVHLNRVPEHAIAQAVLEQQRVRTRLALKVPNEHMLRDCNVCGCVLPLKVWVPLEHIENQGFPPNCWIPQETAGVKPQAVRAVEVTVERTIKMGDVILASAICSMLHAQGISAGLLMAPGLREMFEGHPHLSTVTAPVGKVISLNGVWETNTHRKGLNRRESYLNASRLELARHGIKLEGEIPNATLHVTDDEKSAALIDLLVLERPLIAISPRSTGYANRNVPDDVWIAAAKHLPGTAVWVGNEPAPDGIFDPGIRTIRRLMAVLSVCDACVSADTGPAHVAIALGIPTTVIEGPFLAGFMLAKCGKWNAVHAELECLGCGEFKCPIDEKKPPCVRPSPKSVADAVKAMLP